MFIVWLTAIKSVHFFFSHSNFILELLALPAKEPLRLLKESKVAFSLKLMMA